MIKMNSEKSFINNLANGGVYYSKIDGFVFNLSLEFIRIFFANASSSEYGFQVTSKNSKSLLYKVKINCKSYLMILLWR